MTAAGAQGFRRNAVQGYQERPGSTNSVRFVSDSKDESIVDLASFNSV